jgi:hypothetical protein
MKAILLLLTVLPFAGISQMRNDDALEKLIRTKASANLLRVLDNPDTFHYQLIYTRIDRDARNRPVFTNQYVHVNADDYFNPASTVKLPLALLALEKLNGLRSKGIDRNTTMLTDSSYAHQSAVTTDTSAANGLPSIAQYIKKIFLVSDNDAYNRLYEFLGQQYINESLSKKGFANTRITRRFVPMTEEENRHTNAIRFVDGSSLLLLQPPQVSEFKFDFSKKVLVGNAYYDRNEQLVQSPMDFTTHNKLALTDLQQMLQAALFPASLPLPKRFNISAEDYKFLRRYMSMLPFESRFPNYDTTEFFNSYTKFFLYRAGKTPPQKNTRIFNKAGWSYGFLTEAAYIVDFETRTEFMLTASIYVNSDGVLNDDKYDYETIGYPFFAEIGRIIYAHERARKKPRLPDLRDFVFDYRN